MSFAGISVFPSEDKYFVSITCISADGSVIGSKTSTSTTLAELGKTINALVSQFPQSTISSYLGTVPPDFPPDRYYEVLQVFELGDLKLGHPSLLKNHAYAYCANVQKDSTTQILFLDFSTTTQLLVAYMKTTDVKGERETVSLLEASVSIGTKPLQETLTATLELYSPNGSLQRVILHDPPSSMADLIQSIVASRFANIPIYITAKESISEAAAKLVYDKSLLRPRHILAQYIIPLPVSVATAGGSAVTLAPPFSRVPLDEFITLTTSKENQSSLKVCLLLGNHPLAKDNLERGIAILNGLKPMPKGQARIRVSIEVCVLDGWRDAAKITISQEGGPSKTFMFYRFFENLTEDDDVKYEILNGNEVGYEHESENVVGDLPQ